MLDYLEKSGYLDFSGECDFLKKENVWTFWIFFFSGKAKITLKCSSCSIIFLFL